MPPATAPTVEKGYARPSDQWWYVDDETTPELQWPSSVGVYNYMRHSDAQVASVLRAVILPVLRTTWRVDPQGARARVTNHVADDLGLPILGKKPRRPQRLRDRFSWSEHLRNALMMLVFGHSFFEQVYRVGPDGLLHVRKLGYRSARTIAQVNVALDGGLISVEQYPPTAGASANIVLPVDHLVGYVHEKEGGNWLGTSLLRPAYKNWLIKDRLLRVQAQTVERNGMGVPLYKGQEGASDADLDRGAEMAQAWRSGQNAGTSVPFGADLILRGVEGDLPDADSPIRYHDEQIARTALGHFLNLGSQGGGQVGSYALGSEFANVFTQSLQTLAQQVAEIATAHIVEDLVDLNWGDDEPAPAVTFDEIGSRYTATADALKALVDSGLVSPDVLTENHIRTSYGLPQADPETAKTPPEPAETPNLPQETVENVSEGGDNGG